MYPKSSRFFQFEFERALGATTSTQFFMKKPPGAICSVGVTQYQQGLFMLSKNHNGLEIGTFQMHQRLQSLHFYHPFSTVDILLLS